MSFGPGDAVLALGCGAAGVAIAPYLSALVWRVPRNEPVWPPGRGPRPLHARIPLMEIATGLLFAITALRIGPHAGLIAFLYVVAVGWVLGIIDMQCKRLPNALTYTSYPIALGLLGIAAAIDRRGDDYRRALIGMGIFFAFYAFLWLVYPAGLGLGDVKLSGVLGLYLGWLGWGAWAVGLFLGFMLGGVLSGLLLAIGRANRKTRIPFGPFMLAGAMIAVLFGAAIAHAYVGASLG